MDLLRKALIESEAEETAYREAELGDLRKSEMDLEERLKSLYPDKLRGEVPAAIFTELKLQWEMELAAVEARLEAFGKARRHYEDECLCLCDFASNAYSRFKTASRDDQCEMAFSLLSNSTITRGIFQVCLHEAFEMILEENARMTEESSNSINLAKWLPD